jgi:CO/xanthine dehydrogenase Mo-binding subunit
MMTNENRSRTSETAGPLYGVLVHATASPGKLVKVDGSAARAAGAIVLTGQLLLDLDPYIGPVVRDLPLLAIDRIRYTGEPVAVVAAESLDLARAAASKVTYEVAPLPAAVTGAPEGQPALVHLTELLRPGPLADGIDIHRERTNRLIWDATDHEPLSSGTSPVLGSADLLSTDPPEPERLEAAVTIEGSIATLTSASSNAPGIDAQLAQLFDPAGLTIVRESGASGRAIALSVDALAIALARHTRRAVRLMANTADFRWSGTRGHLEVIDAAAVLTIPAGASAGMLPQWVDEFRQLLETRFALRAVTIAIDYSEAPPIAASLDDWRGSLAPR